MRFTLIILLFAVTTPAQKAGVIKTVYRHEDGVIKWGDTKKELALFDANYCLPYAFDYRAGTYVTGLKKYFECKQVVA